MQERRREVVRRRRWPDAVYATAERLLREPGATPSSVADGLAELFEPAPAERTIGEWIAKGVIQRADPSELWSVASASAEEARLVLPVLAGVIEHTRGRVKHLTCREAAWIAKLRQLSEELMPAWVAYQVADAYIYLEDHQLDTSVIDHYLAFAHWRSWPMPNERYRKAIDEWGVEWLGWADAPATKGDDDA